MQNKFRYPMIYFYQNKSFFVEQKRFKDQLGVHVEKGWQNRQYRKKKDTNLVNETC